MSKKTISTLAIAGAAGAVAVAGIGLVSSSVYADDSVVDEINITIPVSCTMTGTGMNSHATEINNGIYTADIGTTTMHAFCNDNEGFAIYAVGYTGNEIGTTNSNKLVGTSASNNATIDTGLATSAGNPDISNWAMKLAIAQDSGDTTTNPFTIDSAPNTSGGADASFSDYHVVPNEYTKVAHKNFGTDMTESTGGAKLTTTYSAYISKTQPADTYTGQVKYTLVHPASEIPLQPQTATSGCINYFPNGSNVEGTMGCQSIGKEKDWGSCYETDNETYCLDEYYNAIDINTLPDLDSYKNTYALLASNYSRAGYGFAGWSDVYDYATNPNAKFYGPQETITFTAGQYTGTNNGLSLYAVWIKSQGSIQDTTKVAELCGTGANALTTAPTDGTANLSSVSALTDQRDNQTYAIAKLADGKCWMIENLRLENTNSDNSTGALAQGYGTSATYGNFSGLANPESANFAGSTTANSLYYFGTQDGTASIDIGTSNYPGFRMPRYNNLNTTNRASNPTSNSFSYDNTTGGMYSYGNYYTWHAAIADTTNNDTTNSSSNTTSLCPSGWRLPQGGDKTRITSNNDNDFWNLTVDALNNGTNPANYDSQTGPYYTGTPEGTDASNALRAYPNNFLYSGDFNTSSALYRGSYGHYWSSTAYNGYNSCSLDLGSSFVSPGTDDNNNKYNGFSVRCMVSAGT